MQDRYAGDIGDFGKIGLLKALQTQGLSVGVNWYRVEPMDTEKKEDGTYKQEDGKYLIPEKLQVCDASLAEQLTKIAKSNNRSIKSLKKEISFLMQGITVNRLLLPDAMNGIRELWFS